MGRAGRCTASRLAPHTLSVMFFLGICMNVETMASTVRKWAEGKPQIFRIHFFGSRIKGTNRPESDLDIALAIKPHINGSLLWFEFHEIWLNELNAIIPFDVQLELDEGDKSPTIQSGLNEASHLVYECEKK